MVVVIVLICALAFVYLGRKVRIPIIIGYFVTGIIVGPYGLSLITAEGVEILAELGVILLMFTIGLEVSLKNLLAMKRIVLVGGGLQEILTTLAVFAALTSLGVEWNTALFIGFMIATSSTAIVLNIYQKSGEVDKPHGKIALGILIFQDLAVIPIMILMPLLASPGTGSTDLTGLLLNLLFGMVILAAILFGSLKLVPILLRRIALTRSSELFIITIIVICFGIAWLMSLNGVSLALGAFLAGVAISESDYSHEVIGEIMPFRDLLTSFFFVSIGMMLNLGYVWEHIGIVIGAAVLVVAGKFLINFVSVKLLGVATGIALLSAFGLSQIGEFSFILGTMGIANGLLPQDIYQIFLAVSILTMALAPFLISTAPKIVKRISTRYPGAMPPEPAEVPEKRHVIIVGFGIAGRYVALALKRVNIPYIILEMNAATVAAEKKKGENIVYGDASREAMLEYAGVARARTIVISIPQTESVKAIITEARRMNPKIGIITRSRFISETSELYRLGADEVIVDEREAAIQIFRRILANEQVPVQDVNQYAAQLRADVYNKYIEAPITSHIRTDDKIGILDTLRVKAARAGDKLSANSSSVEQIRVEESSSVAGQHLSDMHMRAEYGVSVIAVKRGNASDTIVAPDGDTMLQAGDTVVVIGDRSAISEMMPMFMEKRG